MINKSGNIGEMVIGRGNRNTRLNPSVAPLRSPRIPHDTWDRTHAAALETGDLIASAMAWLSSVRTSCPVSTGYPFFSSKVDRLLELVMHLHLIN
jgi:hypothetical protein